MRQIFSPLKKYWIPIGIAFLLMLTELFTELINPIFMGRVIDLGIREENLSQITYWGSLMVIMALIAFVSGIINSFFSSYVSQHFGYDLRMLTYAKVQQFSFKNLNKFPTSSLITRLTNDVTQIQNFVFMLLRIATRAPLLVIGSMVMALLVDFQLSLILLLLMPILVCFMILLMHIGYKYFLSIQRKLDRVNHVMRENLTGMRLIKAFMSRDLEAVRFERASRSLRDTTIFTLRLMEVGGPVILLVMNIGILVILYFAGNVLDTGRLQVGEVVAILNYATRMMQAIGMLSWITLAYTRAHASMGRIKDVLDESVDLVEGEKEQVDVKDEQLIFDHVAFRYEGTKKDVLKDLNLTIKRGEQVAVIGATGSGKSTLFQLIPRLYDPTEGEISFNGTPLKAYSFDTLRESIGYVPQVSRLFSGSVRDNLSFGHIDATEEEIKQAAEQAQIAATIERLPEQYETKIGQRGVNLSGGQKQRLAIARAFLRRPELLLLDDATSALDLETEQHILDAIRSMQCTTIMITQKVQTMQKMDRIILLDNGELLASGDFDTLQETTPLFRKIVQSQQTKGGE